MAFVETLSPESSVETAFKEKDEFDRSDDTSYPSRRKLNVDLTGTKEGGLGMVIVGGYKDGKQFGIFVKTIKENGPVFKDGRIRVGDQLLAANGKSLLGVSNDQAVQTLKQCALTDEVILAIVRDVASRHDFKRLSQVMNFNPGETPPEIRDVRHTVIPTMDQSRSSSPTSSLTSVSDDLNPEQDGDNGFKSSSTPAVLEDVRKGGLVYTSNYVSSSLQELGRYRQEKDSESPISQDKNVSATDVKLSMTSSPHSKSGEEVDTPDKDKGLEEVGMGNHVPPPCPTSPIPDEEVPPPLPGDPPPLDEDSDESEAPSLPPTLPPKQTDSKLTEDSLAAETSFNKRLTFIFPKMLGIGITVKGGTNMPNGPAVYIDKVIRGLDAAKDSNLRSGDQLIAVNGESYEGLTQEEAQKQLTMLKTKHQLRKYEIVVDREVSEEEMVNYEPPMKTPTKSPPTVSPPTKPPPTEPPPTEPPPTEPPPTEPPPTNSPLEESPSGETPPVVLPLGTTKKWLNGSIEDGDDEGSGRNNRESVQHNGIHGNLKTSSETRLTPSLPKDSPPSETSSKSSLHGQKDTGRPDEMTKMEEYRTRRDVVDGPVLGGTKPREEETIKASHKQEEPNIFVAATLPVGSTKPSRESGGSHRVSIDPATPMKDTPTRERREHDSSYHARLSLDPYTRVKLSKLEMGLRYTGHNLSSQQQQELRKQLNIDEEGKVTFAEFIDVAREMFAFKLDDHMFEPGSLFSLALSPKDNLEPPIFSKRAYSMISNSDSSHSSHGASMLEDEMEAKRQQLYEEGKQRVQRRPSADVADSLKKQVEKQQDEIRRLKARLVDSEVITRQLEVKLQGSEMQSSAKASDVESLKKRLTLSEAACKAAKIKEGHLNEVVHGLQQQLAAAKKQVIDQTPAEMKRRMTVLDCQLKKEQASNRRYQVAMEMMLQFCEKSHETLVASADMGPVVFHPRGKGESVRRGDPISGNPRPPQYLAQHSKRTNVTLAQEAKEVVKSVRTLLGKDELPFGWEESRTEEGEKYYINHQTQSTSWVRPPSSRSGSGASTPQHGRVNV